MPFKWKTSPDVIARSYLGRIEKLRNSQVETANQAGKIAVANAGTRAWMARQVNKQDSQKGKVTLPRTKNATFTAGFKGTAAVATVSVLPFWSKARSRTGDILETLFRLISQAGGRDSFFRKGLITKKRGFVPFFGNSWLQSWALRKDKGQQFFRHAVRIKEAPVLERLILKPALEFTRKKIMPIWLELTRKALK